MAWIFGATNAASIILLIIATVGCAPEVDTYAARNNYTTTPMQQNTFRQWNQGVGVCPKEVRIGELFKKTYRVLANTADPEVKVVFQCCPGYKKAREGVCEPICEKPCRNGKCVGPNQCKCFFGFVQALNNDCVTTCPFECLNGKCDASGACKCNPGFRLDETNSFCMPICSEDCGLNGNCTAPSTCGCSKGHEKSGFTHQCEPVCDPSCGLGFCIAPGQCQCYSGYRIIDQTCQANCSRGCENGRCVANEVCRCDFGWSLDSGGNKCEPVCSRGCRNGVCVGPNTCKCFEGYKKEINRTEICIPHCEHNCINGRCAAPNMCRCRAGYQLGFSDYHCKRIRVRFPGVGIRLPKTKPGYIPSEEKQLPVGKDISSEEELPSTAIPDENINEGCENGRCVANDVCRCGFGWKLHWFGNKCDPVCSRGCKNGVCVGPDTCECFEGYKKEINNTNVCIPNCERFCKNGYCVAPNMCRCRSGYYLDLPDYECKRVRVQVLVIRTSKN